jgi:hypothetical protein
MQISSHTATGTTSSTQSLLRKLSVSHHFEKFLAFYELPFAKKSAPGPGLTKTQCEISGNRGSDGED